VLVVHLDGHRFHVKFDSRGGLGYIPTRRYILPRQVVHFHSAVYQLMVELSEERRFASGVLNLELFAKDLFCEKWARVIGLADPKALI